MLAVNELRLVGSRHSCGAACCHQAAPVPERTAALACRSGRKWIGRGRYGGSLGPAGAAVAAPPSNVRRPVHRADPYTQHGQTANDPEVFWRLILEQYGDL